MSRDILSWLGLDAAGAGCWCGFAARYWIAACDRTKLLGRQ